MLSGTHSDATADMKGLLLLVQGGRIPAAPCLGRKGIPAATYFMILV